MASRNLRIWSRTLAIISILLNVYLRIGVAEASLVSYAQSITTFQLRCTVVLLFRTALNRRYRRAAVLFPSFGLPEIIIW